MKITLGEYQELASRTEKPLAFPDRLNHGMLGIITEAGELGDAIKKFTIYDKPLDISNIHEEVGDLFWYIAVICNTCNISMEEAIADNIAKLQKRYPEKYTNEAALARADKNA